MTQPVFHIFTRNPHDIWLVQPPIAEGLLFSDERSKFPRHVIGSSSFWGVGIPFDRRGHVFPFDVRSYLSSPAF